MHEFGADRVAISALQGVENFSQGRVGLADMHAAGLENRVEIRCRQLVKGQLEVRYLLTFRQPQGVEPGFLVAALAVGRDQLDNADLLALVIGCLGVVLDRRCRAHPHLADLGEAVANDGVRNIQQLYHRGLDLRQFVEILAPLFRHTVGVLEVDLVEVLHVSRIAARYMRAAPQLFHRALLHPESFQPVITVPRGNRRSSVAVPQQKARGGYSHPGPSRPGTSCDSRADYNKYILFNMLE